MKIAISSMGKTLNDSVSDAFARCLYFIIIEIENDKILQTEIIKNINANQLGQAGTSVAQLMAEKNINVILTKNIGPRALDALKQFEIKIYSGEGIIKNVLQKFIENKLEKIN